MSEVKTKVNVDQELFTKFKAGAEALSAEVHRVADIGEARQLATKIISELGIEMAVYAPSELVDAVDVVAIGNAAGVQMKKDNLRENAATAGLGISQLDYGIAEIGTLVGNSTSIESRLVSILPPIHLVFVRTKNILPTLSEVIALYNKDLGQLPRYLTFVSGPSRTADIERVLTIGVHGPGRLIIVLID